MQFRIEGVGKDISHMMFSVESSGLPLQCGIQYLNNFKLGVFGGKPGPVGKSPWDSTQACWHTLREVYELLDTQNFPDLFYRVAAYLMTDEVACWRNGGDHSSIDLDEVRKGTNFLMADFVNYLIYKKIGVVTRTATSDNKMHMAQSVVVAWHWIPRVDNVISADAECFNPKENKKHPLADKAHLFLRQQKAAANGYAVQ